MVELRDFSAFFHQHLILNNLSATFPPQTITSIIGPSGSGKTTLLRAINRTAELQPGFRSTGQITVNDDPIYAVPDPSAVRRKIGLVLQKPLALPLSIKENILFGPRYYGIKKNSELNEIVEDTLHKTALWHEVKDKLHSPAANLSGGQLQRLSLGRILAVRPQILLLDEPCSSLDMKSTQLLEELIQQLSHQLTVILVTHNLAQAKRLAAKTIFMESGCIVEANATNCLFGMPSHPSTQIFLSYYSDSLPC